MLILLLRIPRIAILMITEQSTQVASVGRMQCFWRLKQAVHSRITVS